MGAMTIYHQGRSPHSGASDENRLSRLEPYEIPFSDEALSRRWAGGPSLGDRIERLLQQLVILVLVALVLVQMLLVHPDVRKFLVLMERIEGTGWLPAVSDLAAGQGRPAAAVPAATADVRTATGTAPNGRLRLMVTSQPAAATVRLLANGQFLADFSRGDVVARVTPGTALQLDARGATAPTTIRVVEAAGLEEPALGQQVTVRPGEIKMLGVAR